MKKTLLATTALVLSAITCFAGQTTNQSVKKIAPGGPGHMINFKNTRQWDANAQVVAWYGRTYHPPPRNGEMLLYDQSESSGFAEDAVVSWENDSAHYTHTTPDLAADDFVIPGTGSHTITAVYAAGTTGESYDVAAANVIFFDKVRYNRKTGTTMAIVKAQCLFMPFSDQNGIGNLMVDVSSCNTGRFKGGHDYAVSVQGVSAGDPAWYWQTNKKKIGRPGFWWDNGGGGNGSCYQQLTPIKICFPTRGYGPDLAFAIYGN